ncbi:hypothetical protein VPNG_08568 [Cytospora leucostoma]|uniref:F-box domain-containing protein n=1 Tax=Cytospora leucostoma TaxID=1230097 RepID=A0A423W471_9PEZI|nr:hypothetical protein VPNG_08568 [Cytospora leucostoma]
MASIVDLPPELLDRVCELIPSQATLAQLVRCSHQFYDVAAPHLYQSIELSRTRSKDEFRHLEVITALLLRKPELGRSVRHLALREGSRRSVEKNEKPLLPEIEQAVRDLAAQTGRLLDPPSTGSEDQAQSEDTVPDEVEVEVEDWPEDDAMSDVGSNWSTTDGSDSEEDPDDVIPTDATDALSLARSSQYFRDAILLALFIPCLTKLTSMDLDLLDPTRLRFVQALLRSAVGTEQLFSHVKTVCLGSSMPELRLDLWRDLFTLPSISSIYLHRIIAVRQQTMWGRGPSAEPLPPNAALRPRSLDITHLELRDCRISPWELRRMLAVPKALKTFIYDMGEEINDVEPPVTISYRSVREALELQKDSLEQIWIDYPHDYLFDEWGGSGIATRPMGSFDKFKKLKRFRIASTYLFGFTEDTDIHRLVESLPENLEELHLTHGDEDEELTAGLQKLIEARQRGRFADLNEIKVEVCLPWLVSKGRPPLAADHTRANKDVMAELVQRADGLGLKMRMFVNHSQSRTYSPDLRIQFASRGYWEGLARKESKWGFDGEVEWPQRMSNCMKRPDYPEIRIDEQGVIRPVRGGGVADIVPPRAPPRPSVVGPVFFLG